MALCPPLLSATVFSLIWGASAQSWARTGRSSTPPMLPARIQRLAGRAYSSLTPDLFRGTAFHGGRVSRDSTRPGRLWMSYAKGFGSNEDHEKEQSVRVMTTGELKAEIESYGLPHDDCSDRTDLERKLTAVRRGTYREGKIKSAEDAGGYLRKKLRSSPSLEVVSGSSQENKASTFDEHMRALQKSQASSFDTVIQERIHKLQKKGQRVFDLLSYPCEHEIKIVGAQEHGIENQVRSIVADTTGTDPSDLKTSSREKGKWISVSVMVPVSSSQMLYDCYSRLKSVDTFRFVI
ncbi:hypothetical protein AAMO2058_001148800 [Amorphochlora amoebiformis]